MALAANALTTVATMESELGLAAGSATTLLERYINTASAAIERWLGRDLRRETRTEKYRAPRGARLLLRTVPVASITGITDDGVALPADSYAIESAGAGILFAPGGWPNRDPFVPRSIAGDVMVGLGQATLEVTYVAGYVLPNDSGTRDLPYDIEEACILTVTSRYRSRGRDRTIASKGVGDASVGYRLPNAIIGVDQGGIIPTEATTLLAPYRRIAVIE